MKKDDGKGSHDSRDNQRRALCMAALLCMTVLVTTCGGCNSSRPRNDTRDVAEIQNRSGINFPASTKWIAFKLDRGMDYFFVGLFTLTKREIPLLLSIQNLEWSTSRRAITNKAYNASWFNPDSVASFKSTEINSPNSHSNLKILYDDSGDEGTTTSVYMIWYELE